MQCPKCGTSGKHKVLDTTPDDDNIRRRRECTVCGYRFNTLEKAIVGIPMLVKSDGSREEYRREKMLRGIRIACAKRPVAAIDIDRLVNSIEDQLRQLGRSEVESRVIGDMVIAGLKDLDLIAYVRYAIVYLGLNNLYSIRAEIDTLLEQETPVEAAADDAPPVDDDDKLEANVGT
jgi:transcriptional repressor NrdR